MSELTQRGISALKAGDRSTARKLLAGAVQQDESDVTAWLWLAGALDKDEERVLCLKQVLRLDPDNPPALRGLAQLEERIAHAAPPPAARPDSTPAQPAAAQPISAPQAGWGSAPADPLDAPAPDPQAALDEFRRAFAAPGGAIELPPGEWVAPTDGSPQPAGEEPAPAPAGAPAGEVWPAPVEAHPATGRVETAQEAELPEAQADVFEARVRAVEMNAAENSGPNAAAPAAGPAQPAVSGPADGGGGSSPSEAGFSPAPARPARHKARLAESGDLPLVIFRTRPTLVPALICFWLFLFGAIGVGALLSPSAPQDAPQGLPQSVAELAPYTGLLLAAGLGLLLELVVIFAIFRNLATRYELTTRRLTARFRGQRERIAVEDIYGVECRQSGLQRLFGAGTLDLDVSVNGELARVSLRDVPRCRQRLEQIREVIE